MSVRILCGSNPEATRWGLPVGRPQPPRRKFTTAGYSTISDYKDNVHWFEAITEPAFIFNIHVLNVNPDDKRPTGRVYLNPKGEKLKGGLIRAPRVGYKEAHRLFG